MRRWLLYLACGLTCLPLAADEPGATVATAPAPALAPPADPAVPTTFSQLKLQSPDKVQDDGAIHDSLGLVAIRPVPDATESLPEFLRRVDYLRHHHDDILAIAYLRQVVSKGDIAPRYRARGMLEMADCLAAEHQEPEALCWLKIWTELYPGRPEMGAVDYRIAALYTQMGLPDLARDAYYAALSSTVNEAQVQDGDDLKQYTRLTVATLWGLAANEYQGGQWARAGELFARYQKEATSASATSREKAAYLQADCYYQLHKLDQATALYEQTLTQHPFNPLAPEARLRLYQLYILANRPLQARDELQSLAWTVRTVWPQDETYWQKQTAQLLLAINKKNMEIMPPLVTSAARLPVEGKSWQDALSHYDTLVSYEAAMTPTNTDTAAKPSANAGGTRGPLDEETELAAMDHSLNQLLPPPRLTSNQ